MSSEEFRQHLVLHGRAGAADLYGRRSGGGRNAGLAFPFAVVVVVVRGSSLRDVQVRPLRVPAVVSGTNRVARPLPVPLLPLATRSGLLCRRRLPFVRLADLLGLELVPVADDALESVTASVLDNHFRRRRGQRLEC